MTHSNRSFLRIASVMILAWLGTGCQSTTTHNNTQNAVHKPDTYGSTALINAAVVGNIEVVRDLIERGADVNGHDTQGNFPLYAAVIGEHSEVVELLIERGANVNEGKAVNAFPQSERNTTALYRS